MATMKFRIPHIISTAWDAFEDWANVTVWWEVRRIDVLVILAGAVCVSYYGYFYGWRGAVVGAAVYVLVVMMTLLF